MNKTRDLKTILRFFCSLAALLIQFEYLSAQTGSLDSSFNKNGILMTSNTYNVGIMALQPDGRIVVGKGYYDNNFQFVNLSRYKMDGTPDTSFGNNGIIAGRVDNDFSTLEMLKLGPDGKIWTLGDQESSIYFMARYLPDGRVDSSFGLHGKLKLDFTAMAEAIIVLTIQPDGKVLLGGSYRFDNSSGFLIRRLNSDGSPDYNFGSQGVVHTTFSTHISLPDDGVLYSDNAIIKDIIIQNDGKIIAAGTQATYLNDLNFDSIAVARYKTDGSPDSSLNGNGQITINPPNIKLPAPSGYGSEANSVALQSDGKILVGGNFSYLPSHGRYFYSDFGLIRFNANGTLDSSFNGNGIKNAGGGSGTNVCVKIVLQSDGKIVMAGNYGGIDLESSKIVLERINSDGSEDHSFGQDGKVFPTFTDIYNNLINSNISGMGLDGQRIYIESGQMIGGAISALKNDGTGLNPRNLRLCSSTTNASISTDLPGVNYQWQLSTDGVVFNNIVNDNYYAGTTTASLSLNSISSSWQGHQYRCLVTNGVGNVTTIRLLTANENEWTGAVSDAWEDAANWRCGTVPGNTTRVIIANGNPVIHSNVNIDGLQLKPGVSLIVATGYSLTITHEATLP